MLKAGAVLEARNISKRFPGVLALDDASIAAFPGEVLAVVGENGAGKSTLMKILSGALQPDEGQILLDGRPVQLADPRQALGLGIAIIYQELSVIDNLTIGENDLLGRLPHRPGLPIAVDWPEVWRRTAALLERVGAPLDPRTPVARLSVAQKQMVEIARALSQNVRMLSLDEPTRGGDVGTKAEVHAIMAQLAREGVGMLMISSELPEILAMSHRVLVMCQGRIVAEFACDEATEERILAAATGEPALIG
jgi:ribose transport system ATP-binding protein